MLIIAILAKTNYLLIFSERKGLLWFPGGKDRYAYGQGSRTCYNTKLYNRN